jgi:uncharacterized protein involved in exopolysaccharide biosynthesis
MDELSIVELRRGVARRWRWLVVWPATAALVGALAAVAWPKSWTSVTTFVPEQTSATGSILNGAMGGLGALVGGGDALGSLTSKLKDGPTPDFFADVLQSQELLTATLRTRFPVTGQPGRSATLLEQLDAGGDTPERQLGNALRVFRRKVVVDVIRRSSIVSLSITLRDAQLSAAVANRMLELLNTFNLERRQLASREQRRFAEQRLAVAQRELEAAEAAKRDFLERNRGYKLSPRLAEEFDALERRADIKQTVLLGLARTFEESRVAEVRDTPLITIVDRAVPADRPAQRPLPWGGAAAVLGFLVAISAAIFGALQDRPAAPAGARRPREGSGEAAIRAVS